MEPPTHLTDEMKDWWRAVDADYQLAPSDYRLLQVAAEAWDRAQEARRLIARDGLVVETARGGLKAHPAVIIERDARAQFGQLLARLGLEPPAVVQKPWQGAVA